MNTCTLTRTGRIQTQKMNKKMNLNIKKIPVIPCELVILISWSLANLCQWILIPLHSGQLISTLLGNIFKVHVTLTFLGKTILIRNYYRYKKTENRKEPVKSFEDYGLVKNTKINFDTWNMKVCKTKTVYSCQTYINSYIFAFPDNVNL